MEKMDLFETPKKGMIDIAIWDKFCSFRVTGETYQCLHVILRKTFAYGINRNQIKNSEFCELTGLSASNVIRALNKLVAMNVIIREKNKFGHFYSIQKDVKKWVQLSNQNEEIINSDNSQIINADNSGIINIDNSSQQKNNENDCKINKNHQADKQIINADNSTIENDCKINVFLVKKAKKLYYDTAYHNISLYNKNITADINNINILKNIYSDIINIYNIIYQEEKNKKSLLGSKNAAQRLLGYFCLVFLLKYENLYKVNFGKDMAIINRIYATYGEIKCLQIITKFFDLVSDEKAWEYGKAEFEVLEMSCNKICVMLANNKNTNSDLSAVNAVKTAESVPERVIAPVIQKKELKTVNFNVMMNDLKAKYGQIGALEHIEEYQRNWKEQLQKIVNILSVVVGK